MKAIRKVEDTVVDVGPVAQCASSSPKGDVFIKDLRCLIIIQ